MAISRVSIKENEAIWNPNKAGGWEKYLKKTDEAAGEVKEIVNNEGYYWRSLS